MLRLNACLSRSDVGSSVTQHGFSWKSHHSTIDKIRMCLGTTQISLSLNTVQHSYEHLLSVMRPNRILPQKAVIEMVYHNTLHSHDHSSHCPNILEEDQGSLASICISGYYVLALLGILLLYQQWTDCPLKIQGCCYHYKHKLENGRHFWRVHVYCPRCQLTSLAASMGFVPSVMTYIGLRVYLMTNRTASTKNGGLWIDIP